MANQLASHISLQGNWKFGGPVEVDETYIGGKERNKHESKKRHAGRGAVGKMAVVGAKDRETGQVSTAAIASTVWHTPTVSRAIGP